MTGSVHNLRYEEMRPGDVRVDRATMWGNPFVIGRHGDRATVIRLFEEEMHRRMRDPYWRGSLRGLAGRRLFCWCAPKPCHADVLLRLANALSLL